jgi:hypothetical protein
VDREAWSVISLPSASLAIGHFEAMPAGELAENFRRELGAPPKEERKGRRIAVLLSSATKTRGSQPRLRSSQHQPFITPALSSPHLLGTVDTMVLDQRWNLWRSGTGTPSISALFWRQDTPLVFDEAVILEHRDHVFVESHQPGGPLVPKRNAVVS